MSSGLSGELVEQIRNRQTALQTNLAKTEESGDNAIVGKNRKPIAEIRGVTVPAMKEVNTEDRDPHSYQYAEEEVERDEKLPARDGAIGHIGSSEYVAEDPDIGTAANELASEDQTRDAETASNGSGQNKTETGKLMGWDENIKIVLEDIEQGLAELVQKTSHHGDHLTDLMVRIADLEEGAGGENRIRLHAARVMHIVGKLVEKKTTEVGQMADSLREAESEIAAAVSKLLSALLSVEMWKPLSDGEGPGPSIERL